MHFHSSRALRLRVFSAAGFAAISAAGQAQTVAGGEQPAAKKPGVIRIGVLMPRSDLGTPGDLSAGEPIRTAERQLLASTKTEAVRINALLPAQALEEAKALECDYLLTSSVSQKVKTGGFGGLRALGAMAPMAGMVPKVGAAGMMSAMNLASTAEHAMSIAASTSAVKAKAEVTFEYSLSSVAGSAVVSDSEKAKAKTDGEDVLSPMIQQAATHILASITK
ncbi:MAG: hypothetical protein JO051_09295 [Acidobacteriaceae bacterium]|nr:hypothetical protein [Acidobacteriaceae bacterium]